MDREKRVINPQIVKLNDRETAIRTVQRNGEVIDFLIDAKTIPLVKRYKWYSHMGYCCCRRKKNREWPLSWELFGKPPKGYVHRHLNGDRRDYRKSNIRLVLLGVNSFLQKTRKNFSTGRRGVSRYADGSYVAIIGAENKRKSFKTLEEAIKARQHFENTSIKFHKYIYI